MLCLKQNALDCQDWLFNTHVVHTFLYKTNWQPELSYNFIFPFHLVLFLEITDVAQLWWPLFDYSMKYENMPLKTISIVRVCWGWVE